MAPAIGSRDLVHALACKLHVRAVSIDANLNRRHLYLTAAARDSLIDRRGRIAIPRVGGRAIVLTKFDLILGAPGARQR